MFPTLVVTAITNDHHTWLPWIAAMAFRLLGAKAKNLWFALTLISLLEIGLKLGIILHDLGNEWKILNLLIKKSRKIRIWIDLSWLTTKIKGKLKKCNHWPLDPKWTLDNKILTTEYSHGRPNNLVLFGFTFWQLKIEKNPMQNVIEEANLVGGPFFYWHPVDVLIFG